MQSSSFINNTHFLPIATDSIDSTSEYMTRNDLILETNEVSKQQTKKYMHRIMQNFKCGTNA